MENKGKKKLAVIITISAMIGVIIIATMILSEYNSPKSKFIKALNKLNDRIITVVKEEKQDKNTIWNTKEYSANINLNLKEEDQTLEKTNTINTIINYIKNDNEQFAEITMDENENNILKTLLLQKNDKLYLTFPNLITNYYSKDFNYTMPKKSNLQHIDILTNIIIKNINKNIKKDYFKESKATLTVNDKEYSTKRISYYTTKKMLNNMIISSLEEMSKDKNSLQVLNEITNLTEEEIQENLKKEIDRIKNDKKNLKETITLNIYLKRKDPIMIEIKSKTNTISYFEFDKTKEIKIMENQATTAIITMENNKVSGTISNLFHLEGEIKENNLEMIIFPSKVEEGNIKINLTTKKNIIEQNVKEQYQITIKVENNLQDGTKNTINTIDLDVILDKNAKIPEIDITNNKDLNNLTEEEKIELLRTIYNIPLLKNLLNNYFETNKSGL